MALLYGAVASWSRRHQFLLFEISFSSSWRDVLRCLRIDHMPQVSIIIAHGEGNQTPSRDQHQPKLRAPYCPRKTRQGGLAAVVLAIC